MQLFFWLYFIFYNQLKVQVNFVIYFKVKQVVTDQTYTLTHIFKVTNETF